MLQNNIFLTLCFEVWIVIGWLVAWGLSLGCNLVCEWLWMVSKRLLQVTEGAIGSRARLLKNDIHFY